MNNRLSLGQDEFINADLFMGTNNFVELNDENEFYKRPQKEEKTVEDDVEPLADDEFYALLKELGTLNDSSVDFDASEGIVPLSLADERDKFEVEKELAYQKIRLERQVLDYDRAKFERERQAFEIMMKLSEESFQAEKEEYEKQKKIEKERIYLETMELLNSCTNFKEFIENYKKIQDVSE